VSSDAEATFLFADIAGFTALTEAHGDEQALQLVEQFATAVQAELPPVEGEYVKTVRSRPAASCLSPATRQRSPLISRECFTSLAGGKSCETLLSRSRFSRSFARTRAPSIWRSTLSARWQSIQSTRSAACAWTRRRTTSVRSPAQPPLPSTRSDTPNKRAAASRAHGGPQKCANDEPEPFSLLTEPFPGHPSCNLMFCRDRRRNQDRLHEPLTSRRRRGGRRPCPRCGSTCRL
jgi:hypothetical protein